MGTKLRDLNVTTSPAPPDLLYVVISPDSAPADRKVTVDSLFKARTGNNNVLAYASLAAAVTAIGANVATVEIPTTAAITSSLTVPSNITLLFSGPGKVSVSSGQILTINGGLQAPINRQIFTGSGSVRFGGNVPAAYPQWFGAVMNGTIDDASAAQKAIDAFASLGNAPRGGNVIITGPMAVASTLIISNTNSRRLGNGWAGNQSGERPGSYIKWVGSADSPMILIHALGARVENIRLIGKSTAKPSAAIEISETTVFCDATGIRDVWIGPLYGFDDDSGVQFTRGIYFSGSVDSDTNLLERVFIVNCTTGIDIANTNASLDHFDTIQTIGCATGIKTAVPQVVITNWACALNDVDLDMAAQGVYVELYNYVSEGSGRMAIGSSLAPYKLIVRGGGFNCDGTGKFARGNADYDGKRAFIQFKGLAAIATYIDLHDFNLVGFGNPATAVLQCWNTGDNTTAAGGTAVHIKVEACPGILSSTIDVGSDGLVNSERIVEYTPLIYSQTQPQQVRFIQNSGYGSEDNSFEDSRFDLLGKVNIYGGPLKVKALPTVTGVVATATGSGATTYSYKVVALTYDGNTAGSTAATCTNGTLGTGGRLNTVSWYPVHGAYAYQVYGRTSGSEQLMATVTLSEIPNGCIWVDNGSVTPSGALPTANTTGNLSVDNGIYARSRAGDPVAADLMDGCYAVFKNTSSGAVKLWYNDGGTMKSVTMS